MLWLLAVIFSLTFGYWMLKRRRLHWTQKGVQQKNNGFILGDNWAAVMRNQSMGDLVRMTYNMCPGTRYSGFYQFLQPILIVKDSDLIKQITVKDFDHFVNHQGFVAEDGDALFARNLFSLKNQKWRDMRTLMTPAFTSSKMKYMFTLICQNGERFVKHFLQNKDDVIAAEMKDISTRFANDVLANIVFGVEVDSLEDPQNEFYLMGKDITDFGGIWKAFKFFGFFVVPKIYQTFKISPFATRSADFFSNLLQMNLNTRRQQGVVRPDMINILLEAQKLQEKKEEFSEEPENKSPRAETTISDQDIISQGIAFFFAGFESVSTLMSFMSYELAANPDIQEKLIREVDETMKLSDGKITYEALHGMKYMDMVVSECLRKWPSTPATDRLCTKPYTIEAKYPDEKDLHLETGSCIWIPIFGLHWDPKNFPDPERFDPERFNDENKRNIDTYTYLPFGIGPRGCIGSRLALLETKILFFYILSRFEIVATERTQIPLKLSTSQLTMTAEGGFWLGFKRRGSNYPQP